MIGAIPDGAVMPSYRFYFIDSRGHVTGEPQLADAADDADAHHKAKAQLADHDIEIRENLRVVSYLVAGVTT
jgi:hypothetical protein